MTSLAAFRDRRSAELHKLAEEHMQHDLNQSDRDTLRSAGSKIGTHAKIGSLLGLGLGIDIPYNLSTEHTGSQADHTMLKYNLLLQLGRLIDFVQYCAARLRTMRMAYFSAFRAMENPVEVKFADGRTAPVPDLTAQLAPSKWGDAATYFFFSLGGLFFGGEMGFLTGTASASRTIAKDPDSRERIEKAFKNYQIDVMKQQIKTLEGKPKSTWDDFLPGQ